MSNPWKTSWNVLTAAILFLSSLALVWSDFRFDGEILFQDSVAVIITTILIVVWFVIAHFVSVYPKRFLFPILVALICRLTFGYPFSLLTENNRIACLITSGLLAFLCLLYLVGSIFQLIGVSNRPWFQLKHTGLVVLSGVILSIASIPFMIGGLVSAAHNFVGDYARVSFGSISLLERVFTKNGRKVFLVGMMHIGEGHFYEALNRRITEKTDGRRIVLNEGVTDVSGVLPESFGNGDTYGNLARKFGLDVQGEEQQVLSEEGRMKRLAELKDRGVEMVNADIDISELSPEHQKILVKVLSSLDSGTVRELLVSPVPGSELEDLMVDGLIKFRNDRLMEHFGKFDNEGVDEIYIPWGAAHLPDIEDRLVEMGFEKISEERRPIVRFWKR